MVNFAAVPAWGLVAAEAAAVIILCITGLHIAEPRYRQGLPLGVVGIAVVLNFGGAMHRDWRLAPWLVMLISLTFAITALGKRARIFADYQATRVQYGDRSREVTAYTWKLIARMLFIAVALVGLYVVLNKQ